jgi:lysophospholipase L1-like esterase
MKKKPTVPVYGDSLVHGFPGYPFIWKLRALCPGYRILNLGKTGDTLYSLNNRLRFLPLVKADTAILCAGINDIYVRYAPQFKPAKILNGQWWVKDWESYRRLTAQIFDRISAGYNRVILMPPLLLGEDPESPANRDLDTVEQIMKELASAKSNIVFPDIRGAFLEILKKEPNPNPAIADKLWRLIADVFMTRTPEGADRLSVKRGYVLTTDGVHFNNRGAELAASLLAEALQQKLPLSINE